MCVHVCVCWCMVIREHVCHGFAQGFEETCRTWLFPSTIFISVTGLKSSDLVANVLLSNGPVLKVFFDN